MSQPPKPSDICLSIRNVSQHQPFAAALKVAKQVRPTRIEWCYLKDRELIARLKAVAPTFVAALNTISPPGQAQAFTGEPIIAPWMRRFGTPDARRTYICQNNPEDLRVRIEQGVAMIADGVTDTFQFDDWYANGQMCNYFRNPCFCEHCQQAFAEELGLDLHYRRYLRGRGFCHIEEVVAAAERGEVPLWEDYRRFQERTVSRFFRRLKAELDQALGGAIGLSVNGSVLDFGGRLDLVRPFLTYCHGETTKFDPAGLLELAEASRRRELRQIVSLFPDVPVAEYHQAAFVARVKQAIGLCYCLGLLPLFPYDVYAGNEPDGSLKDRWYGTWEEYSEPYEIVRHHPEWFDDFAWDTCETDDDGAVTVTAAADDGRRLRHRLTPVGRWETTAG